MSYASRQDLIDRFGEPELVALTDRAETRTFAIDDTRVARALADADSEIDSYIGQRYAIPLTSVPVLLARLACDLARYQLYAGMGGVRGMPDEVKNRRDDAVALLGRIARGDVSIGLDALQRPTTSTGGPTTSAGTRVFTRDTLEDYSG